MKTAQELTMRYKGQPWSELCKDFKFYDIASHCVIDEDEQHFIVTCDRQDRCKYINLLLM